MSRWCATDIPDLTGRTAVVTGANGGLGFETARALAAHGARVVLAVRDEPKGDHAAGRIRARFPHAQLAVAPLDLADLASIRAFAASYLTDHATLDILVNCAGVMLTPERRTADGFELQLGTNHLGHFALTGLLLPALLARPTGPAARVVTVTSLAAWTGHIDLGDLNSRRRYDPWTAYAQSKLANLLFALELDRRARAAGLTLTSLAAHPGIARTNLFYAGPALGNRLAAVILTAGSRLIGQSPHRGALPILYAATAPAASGHLIGPRWLGLRGSPAVVRPPRQARDKTVSRRLWELSKELTGVSYGGMGHLHPQGPVFNAQEA